MVSAKCEILVMKVQNSGQENTRRKVEKGDEAVSDFPLALLDTPLGCQHPQGIVFFGIMNQIVHAVFWDIGYYQLSAKYIQLAFHPR